MLKKPGKMRWEYSQPAAKLFVADGKQLIVYEPEEEQVIIDPHFESSQLTSSVGFLWGQSKLTESFTIAIPGDVSTKVAGAKIIELRPKKDATYVRLILLVEEKTGKVLESTLFETSGNTNHFKFNNVRTNAKVADSKFTFEPPANVEIIRRP